MPGKRRPGNAVEHIDNTQLADSPPHTPRSSGAGKAKRPTVRPSLRETFLDDLTPVDCNARDGAGPDRDSHDLSLSPRYTTRDSIVDNMLLSLDQFSVFPSSHQSPSHYSGYNDQESYNSSPRYSSMKSARPRGHTYSSSLSSDGADGPSPRFAAGFARGRRSNSSSNFQTGLRRIDSIHGGDDEDLFGSRAQVFDLQRAVAPGERVALAKGRGSRGGSKSNGSSSLDLGQMLASGRTRADSHRRSASFDQGQTRPIMQAPASTAKHPRRVFADDQFDDYEDAAPTPTVPNGPRRGDSPARKGFFPQHQTFVAPPSPGMSRRLSNRSAKSSHTANAQPNLTTTKTTTSTETKDSLRGTMPAVSNQSTLSPALASRQPSVNSSTISAASLPHTRDRPGFFRRVFGTKNVATNGHDTRAQSLSYAEKPPSQGSDRQNMARDLGTNPQHNKPQKAQQREAAAAASQKDNTQTVRKKASFFRRRKFSVSETVPPPILPTETKLEVPDHDEALQISPVSSLRQVMDPYLHSPSSPGARKIGQTKPFGTRGLDPNDGTAGGTFISESDNEFSKGAPVRRSGPRQDPQYGSNVIPKARSNLGVPFKDYSDDSFLADSSGGESQSTRSMHKGEEIAGQITPKLQSKNGPSAPPNRITPNGRDIKKATAEMSDSDQDVTPRPPRKESLTYDLGSFPTPKAFQNRPKAGSQPQGKGVPEHLHLNTHTINSAISRSSPSSADKLENPRNLSLATEAVAEVPMSAQSDISDYTSAKSQLNLTPLDDRVKFESPTINEPEPDPVEEASEAIRENVRKIYDGTHESIGREQSATWLGVASPERSLARKAYFELFDFAGINILVAMRRMCGKLMLKAESQQVDRILDSFANRWCDCNPNHGFKAVGKSTSPDNMIYTLY